MASFEEEIQRIQKTYNDFNKQELYKSKWAPFYEKEVLHRIAQYRELAASLGFIKKMDLSGLRILDVGCGHGRILRSFLDMGALPENLFGVDLRAQDIAENKKLSPGLDFSVTNGKDLNFSKESFDLVTQFVVFSSISLNELRLRLASEMWRVLKPGGYIFWWDLKRSIAHPGYKAEYLEIEDLFTSARIAKKEVCLSGKPSATLR